MKDTHPFDTNGLMIAVNKAENDEQGWFGRIKLFYIDESEPPERAEAVSVL